VVTARRRKRGLRPEGMITVPIPRETMGDLVRASAPAQDYTREHQEAQGRRCLADALLEALIHVRRWYVVYAGGATVGYTTEQLVGIPPERLAGAVIYPDARTMLEARRAQNA
jgi:hypothetical protein